MEFITRSPQETQEIAKNIIKKLPQKKFQSAAVLALEGELGAGKTTFVQGLAKALKIKERVLSPTFVIMRRFMIYDLRFKNFYHIDCYRIEDVAELKELGLEEILKNPENLVVIEWAEKIASILPVGTIWLNFKHKGDDVREIKLKI